MRETGETGSDPQDPQDLETLVTAARSGDGAATTTLLREFDALLRSHLRRRSGGRLRRFADLDDLVQEVHASLISGLDRMRPGGTAEDFKRLLLLHAGWVLGKAGRRAGAFDGESVVGQTSDRPASQASLGTVTRRDRDAWLTERIEELGEESAAVLLGFLAGKPFQEIASELGITEGAARKRFLRASARLADHTEEEGLR